MRITTVEELQKVLADMPATTRIIVSGSLGPRAMHGELIEVVHATPETDPSIASPAVILSVG